MKGAWRQGFHTAVLPVTSAGPIFQAAIDIGKFQGVIRPTLPSGLRVVKATTPARPEGRFSPPSRSPSAA